MEHGTAPVKRGCQYACCLVRAACMVRQCMTEAESATTGRHFKIYRGHMLNDGAPALTRALAPVPVWNLANILRVICSLVNTAIRLPLYLGVVQDRETFGNFACESSRERRYSTP